MAEKRGPGGGPIALHPLVEALVPDPSQPPLRTTKVFGYPGQSTQAGHTRFWLDLELSGHVDIPNDAIRYSRSLDDDAGTVAWVDADVNLRFTSVTSHAAQADFLSGGIATAGLGGAWGGGPIGPLPPTIGIGCPPPSVPCPSFGFGCLPPTAICHTHTVPCASVQLICPSPLIPCHIVTELPACPTHPSVCCPSRLIPCVSHAIVCESRLGPCLTHVAPCVKVSEAIQCVSQGVFCHSQTIICESRICPSVAIPCTTTPGCPIASIGCPDPGQQRPGQFG